MNSFGENLRNYLATWGRQSRGPLVKLTRCPELEQLEDRRLLTVGPLVSFKNASSSGPESVAAVSVSVVLSTASSAAITVNYSVIGGGSATRGDDYVLFNGRLRFNPRQTTANIAISVVDDSLFEGNETVKLALSAPVNAHLGANKTAVYTILSDESDRPPAPSAPHILLTPAVLAGLRLKAADNTPQWQRFKARLDDNLLVNIARDTGAYQASFLTYVSDYALGYQVLKDSDPVTASHYADKAISMLKSGLHDYQKGTSVASQFVARGNGTARTFTLRDTDLVPETLQVAYWAVHTVRLVRSASSAQDTLPDNDFYSKIIKISTTRDGPAKFSEGLDWRGNPNLNHDVIDWSLGGKKPAARSVYYVTVATPFSIQNLPATAFKLVGNKLTFVRPPKANQAVFVEYIHGKSSTDGSTLAFQQTSTGDGGFDSIFIDTTYTSRYLGKHIGMGLDWLDEYPGLTPGLKTEAMSLLTRWADFIRDNGYFKDNPESNYGSGTYVSAVMTGLALNGRSSEGPRLLSEALAYRQANVVPILQNDANSLKGGFWVEGWSYGFEAAQSILLGSLSLETAGQVTATPEHHWATEVMQHLVNAQPAEDQMYNGGDWYMYPTRFIDKSLFYVLSSAADDAAARSYANYILQNYVVGDFFHGDDADPIAPQPDTGDTTDLLFHNPAAAASYWSDLPLQYYASGGGLVTARSDWGPAPTWVSLQMGNLLQADHQTYSPGQLQIQRGDDELLANAQAPTLAGDNNITPSQRSIFGNLIAIDNNGDGGQPDPFGTGSDYGDPGVVIKNYQAGDDFVYVDGDYRAAYNPDPDSDAVNPATELTRQVVYLRPDYIVVYDRVATLKDSYAKQLRWHLLSNPVVTGNSFVETRGQSKLFGQTFSTTPIVTTLQTVNVPTSNTPVPISRLITQNTTTTGSLRYVTAFQAADSSTAAADHVEHILSSDSRMEGVLVGNQLVLFGHDGAVDSTTAVTYPITAAGTVDHLLTNLSASLTYDISVNGAALTTATASAQGTLRFSTTTAGTLSIQVSRA